MVMFFNFLIITLDILEITITIWTYWIDRNHFLIFILVNTFLQRQKFIKTTYNLLLTGIKFITYRSMGHHETKNLLVSSKY